MTRRTKILAGLAAYAVVMAIGVIIWQGGSDGGDPPSGTPAPVAPGEANLLVIMTDDQTLESVRVMSNVRTLLAEQGTTFSRYYVTTPNCCPSRATFYSGQYPHNNGVRDNVPPMGGALLFRAIEDESLGPWMQQAGYWTAHIGKYMNGYGDPNPPYSWDDGIEPQPGWDRWFSLIDPFTYTFYNYKVSVDGEERTYGTAPEDYQTDVLGQEVLDSIDAGVASGKPWFVSWMPVAPHIGQRERVPEPGEIPDSFTVVPAPRHLGMFANEPMFQAPSLVYGAAAASSEDLAGKPKMVQERATADEALSLSGYRAELESLQAIDEWIGRMYDKLEETGQLDSTVIVFASDNGLFHGQHGLWQKSLLYEEAVHVPLIVRGPGFPAGTTATQLTSNIDLAPTLLGIAGGEATRVLDGRDLRPLASDPAQGTDRALLLENWYTFTNTSTQAIRVGDWAYMEWSTGERELYDVGTDPYQMTNLASDPAYAQTITELSQRLGVMRSCAGATCEESDLSRS